MFAYQSGDPLSHSYLKEKQRDLRDGFPMPLTMRVHRGLSWLGRAKQEMADSDVRFIIYPAWATPPVDVIQDDPRLLKRLTKSKYRNLNKPWTETKQKLLRDRNLVGLDFKRCKPEGERAWSVKVDDGNRAHLENLGNGNWLAYAIGGHKEMGHG